MEEKQAVPGPRVRRPSKRDYRLLSELRYLIRCFLGIQPDGGGVRAGLTARQHQALLAVKGAPRRSDDNRVLGGEIAYPPSERGRTGRTRAGRGSGADQAGA